MFYYNSPIDAYNLVKTQTRKQIISYYKTNGIMTLKKTRGCRPCYDSKKIEEEINNLVKLEYLKDNQQKKTQSI
jgi:predicted HTH transcriptional regulator